VNKESFLMYVRDDNYMPIGAIMVKREFSEYNDLVRVAVSLCHPQEIHRFRKTKAWNILNGKMLSENQSIVFKSETLLSLQLDEIFKEFGIKHLEFTLSIYNTSASVVNNSSRVCGNIDRNFAETQLDILRNNTERFHRTFKMMIEEKVPHAL